MSQPTPSSSARPIDQELIKMLVCPITRSHVRQEGDWLITEIGNLKYPIRDGIPVMLPEEATLPEGISDLEEFRKRFQRR